MSEPDKVTMTTTESGLVGIGLYTLAEAARLANVPAAKLARWLRGYTVGGKAYPPLWLPQIDLGDDKLYLSFRDLMEARVAHAFIGWGLSPQSVRAAIVHARDLMGDDRPLSTGRFKTDGKTVFMEIQSGEGGERGDVRLIELAQGQWTFREIVVQTLKHVDFGPDSAPIRWWPHGKAGRIVIDPLRSFGQPIDAETSVPVAALASAARAEGSVEGAARAWDVPPSAVRRAVEFESTLIHRKAA